MMIISRTPLRISFAGGGSDFPDYYHRSAGAVVSSTINKYIYIAIKYQFDGRLIVSYSKTETVYDTKDVENNLVREALNMTKIKNSIHITSIADISSEGTGLGSSSSYIVGLLNALYTYNGQMMNAELLAQKACQVELKKLHKPIGKQDQYAAAYGGLNFIQFKEDHTVHVDPIVFLPRVKRRLEQNLLLLYTGITRSADVILREQQQNLVTDTKRVATLDRMVEMAYEMRAALVQNRLDTFGEILHENWKLKKSLAGAISNARIDKWYETARKQGAIGGKLLGAGGGGFLLFYAPKQRHKDIKHALHELVPLPFRFEQQGSKIIFIGE